MLGENIRKYRKEHSMSQEDLADKLAVSRQSISLWENNQTQPSIENIITLSKLFGISVDDLLMEGSAESDLYITKDISDAENQIRTEAPPKKTRLKKGLIAAIVLAVALVLIVGSVIVWCLYTERNNSETQDTQPQTTTAEVLSAEEIYKLLAKSTVEIEATADTFSSTGSGMFIDEIGTVVTNYHVIESCYQIKVKTYDGTEIAANSIKGYSKELDIAILSTSKYESLPVQIRTEAVSTGEKIYTLGSSLGLTGTFSEGIVSSNLREIAGNEYIQITAPISNGNSGGPLVDECGRVVGITSAGIDEGQNLNLAIPISKLEGIKLDKEYSVFDFFQLSQGKTVEKPKDNTSEIPAEDEEYEPSYIGAYESIKALNNIAKRNPAQFQFPVIVSVFGCVARSDSNEIWLLDFDMNENFDLGVYAYLKKNNVKAAIENAEFANRVYMLDDTGNRAITGDMVIITGIYRHDSSTLSDCTYEFVGSIFD